MFGVLDIFIFQFTKIKLFYNKKEEFKGKLPDYCKIGKIKVIEENSKTDKIVEFLCSISNIVKVDYQVESKGIELDESNEKVMESFDFINNFIENTGDEKLIEIFKSLINN